MTATVTAVRESEPELRTDHSHDHRLTRRQLAITGIVLLVAVAVVLLAAYGPTGVLRARYAVPPRPAGPAACRSNPLLHVHDPSRLRVVSACATTTGQVRQVRYRPADGDWQLLVAPEPAYQHYLRPANHGLLAVKVIPPDLPTVHLPTLGQRATFYGAWVLNRNQHEAAEMYPAWRIMASSTAFSRGAAPARPGNPAGRPGRLLVAVDVPASVVVGARFAVTVRARLALPAKVVPASLTHIFVEMTDRRGQGVRWKAGSTNSLGVAALDFVALDAPGPFALRIYASKSGQFSTADKNLVIRRR